MTFKNDNCPELKTILHLQVFGIQPVSGKLNRGGDIYAHGSGKLE